MWNETEHRIQTRRKGFLVQLSRKESVPWVKETRKVRVFQEKKSSRPATHCRRASVQKEILVIIAIRLSVPSLKKKDIANLGVGVCSRMLKSVGANQRNYMIQWLSPRHWITPKHRIQSLRQNSLRRETFCTGCQPLEGYHF